MNYPESWESAPCFPVPEMLSSQHLQIKVEYSVIIERHSYTEYIYLTSVSFCELLSPGISPSNKTIVHMLGGTGYKFKWCMAYLS